MELLLSRASVIKLDNVENIVMLCLVGFVAKPSLVVFYQL